MISPVTSLLTVALCFWSAQRYIHILQLEGYKLRPYFRWYVNNLASALFIPGLFTLAVMLVQLFLRYAAHLDYPSWVIYIPFLAGGGAYTAFLMRKPAKKPLVYTPRVWRLLGVLIIVMLLITGIFILFSSAVMVLFPLAPLCVMAAAFCAAPMEQQINKWYFKDAQRIINERGDLIRIGITGSFGKTSTKFILGTLLSEKYNTLVTRQSFNTPMGVTKVIREQLKPGHEVFVAEMGARHKGDIAELCELVHPTIGILTAVGKQHIETFKTLDTIAQTKYELIESLPEGKGIAVFAADGAYCEELYRKTEKLDKHLAGLDVGSETSPRYAQAEHIESGSYGSRFNLHIQEEIVPCTTKLLGRHNISNIILCCVVAHRLGLTADQIASGIAKLEPVEHRLQIVPTDNGITVIDDAFNANPDGARAAMEVISSFPGQRIVVTPGLIELGAEEDEQNYQFGREMARAATIAILIGKKRSEPIQRGLKEAGFPGSNIHVVSTLSEATVIIGRVARSGDVVLFENDLPDNYNEA